MTTLNDVQVKLTEQLLLMVKNKEPHLYYSDLAKRITPPIHHRQIGKNIGQISFLCHDLGLPLLSAIVINKSTSAAGEGFYSLYEMLGIPINGKTEKELYKAERKAIRDCTEWYRLEDHLGLSIGLPRPASADASITSAPENQINDIKKAKNNVPINAPYLDARDPQPFKHSVDVLNHCFGEKYLGKKYSAWMRGSIDFNANGIPYTIWFPKLAIDGKAASSSGWINTISADGRIIEEYGSDKDYFPNSNTRFVFAKQGADAYLFVGVFAPDLNNSTQNHHIYIKLADIADFTGDTPSIHNIITEAKNDDQLIDDLRDTAFDSMPDSFEYKGVSVPVPVPKKVEDKVAYPRNRQKAINALIRANFSCEISHDHHTFIRKQSGKPYTEPHHLVPMAQQPRFNVSLDVEENIVSLCSTCHNHIHYGQGAEALIRKLYKERKDILKSAEIYVTEEELLSFY